jgi:HTH-type transcriptional regulator / antitoxin HipB
MAKREPGRPGQTAPSSPHSTRRVRDAPPALGSPATKGPRETASTSSAQPPGVAASGENSEDLQTVFGDNLKAARLKAGLKQSELAQLTGMTQQYLSRIEAGQLNLTLRTMIELAKVLGQEVPAMLRRR